jgi:hypothetical protein
MTNIINLPLNIIKPLILQEELKVISKKFDKSNPIMVGPFVLTVNKIMKQVYAIKSFEEMVYFIQEGGDLTQEEAKRYISDLLFEQTHMYN